MIDFSKIKKLTVDGVDLKSLDVNGVQVWKSGYKNWVPFSINADGTIYNNGLGYKNGYRVRSGGAESVQIYACCTGYIPYTQGDVLRVFPRFQGLNSINTINFYDGEFNVLGQVNDNGSVYGICLDHFSEFDSTVVGEVSVLHLTTDLAADVAYVRITHQIGSVGGVPPFVSTGVEIIVTVNEEMEV